MAADDSKFPGSHQESIAAAIALIDDANSSLVANLVEVELFDQPYDDIVARCVAHRREYDRPPGRQHMDDVFAHIFEDRHHKAYTQYDTIIRKMIVQATNLDTGYVLSIASAFMQKRRMRASIAQAAERYNQGDENLLEDLKGIARGMLKIGDEQRDYGFSLADSRALGFLDRDSRDYCNIGIKELDERGCVPTKREYLAFLSPPNRGKSFFLTHCGKFGMLKGWSIVHYTLENSDDMTAQRYFQTIFSGVRHEGPNRYVALNKDDSGEVRLRTETFTPDFVIDDQATTTKFLTRRVDEWRAKLDRLRIRRFPSGKMTIEMLERDLDELRIAHNFEPDMLLLDMPQLMKLPRRSRGEEDWSALSQLVTELRGLAVERDLAVVAPQQGTRASNTAKSVQAQHGSGAFNIFGIADNMITYSQTPSEEKHGLARLYTQKVRNDRARMTILITQHYDSGQFCMDSCLMSNKMRDQIKEYTGYQSGEDEEDDEYEDQSRRQAR